jgi:hypothetical protein
MARDWRGDVGIDLCIGSSGKSGPRLLTSYSHFIHRVINKLEDAEWMIFLEGSPKAREAQPLRLKANRIQKRSKQLPNPVRRQHLSLLESSEAESAGSGPLRPISLN